MPWTLAKLERDKDLIPIPQQWDDRAGKFVPLRVMEYFGNTIDERPLITDVPLGATYTVVDTQETWQSNGTEWLPKQTKVQLSGTIPAPRKRLLHVNMPVTTQVDAGKIESVAIRCTEGAIATVKHLSVIVPAVAGATSGTHTITLSTPTASGSANQIFSQSKQFNETIVIGFGYGNTSGLKTPEEVGIYISGNNLVFGSSSETQISVNYRNDTDAPQQADRIIFYKVVEEAVTW